jgi:hypothetical protein
MLREGGGGKIGDHLRLEPSAPPIFPIKQIYEICCKYYYMRVNGIVD